MKTIRFSLVLHAHQPTGNFDHVFREAYERCYSPFLDAVEAHPAVPFTLHYSGILLEWLEANEPGYGKRLKKLAGRGQVELLGGGFGEPILVMLGDEDRMGQLREMSRYVEERFGARPRGAWLTERVWEQSLAHDLAAAGIEYSMVDDSHFRLAGLRGDEMHDSFVTEDRGRTLRMFPLSEALRYHIPFQTVEKTIAYLKSLADEGGDRLVVYGDDTEKFGGWPGTHEHVYTNGWLERFLAALEENTSWIRLGKLADALGAPPRAKIYLPDASYREMTEWALPTAAREEYEALRKELGEELFSRAATFFRGGPWRIFLSKYPEAAEMYGKMMDVSRRVAALPAKSRRGREARLDLYRGQTNCAYWHGVFGGLYLPHLRSAIYAKLIAAENLSDRAAHAKAGWAEAEERDLDFDGGPEVRLSSERLTLLVHPRGGGRIYEIDDRERCFNLVSAMTRRPEAYHAEARRSAKGAAKTPSSIHDRTVAKEAGLEELLVFDTHRRGTLVDHFFPPEATLDEVSGAEPPERGDFAEGSYAHTLLRRRTRPVVRLERLGKVRTDREGQAVRLVKEISLPAGASGFDIRYHVRNEGRSPLDALLAVEFVFALLAGNAPDRYLLHEGRNVGPLVSRLDLPPSVRVGARDEWSNLEIELGFDEAAPVWTFPLRTVSLSEGGLESVYQGTIVLPRWRLRLGPGEDREVAVRYRILPVRR